MYCHNELKATDRNLVRAVFYASQQVLGTILINSLTIMKNYVTFGPTELATLPVRSASQGESSFFIAFLKKS